MESFKPYLAKVATGVALSREEAQGLLGGRVGLGGVHEQDEAVVGRELHRLVAQIQLADNGVADLLDTGAVETHVVRGPPDTELLAAGGQLAHQIGQRLVVGVSAGFLPQDRDCVAG